MTEFVAAVFEAVTVGSVFTSALLGVLIGAFYGYYLDPDRIPRFPFPLLFVGWAFVVAFAVFGLLNQEKAPFQPAYQVARAVLWTITCSAIPIGRYSRHLLAEHNIIRFRDGSIPETQDQREDRQFGTERRALEQKHLDDK